MRPYKEITLTTGETKRVPWDEDKSRAKHRMIRAAVIEELRERDRQVCRENGLDRLIREDGLITLTEVVDGKMEGIFKPGVDSRGEDFLPKSRTIMDFWGKPASIAHTGNETTALVIERWHEFCSKPQDDSDVAVPIEHKAKYLRSGSPPVFASDVQSTEAPDDGGSTRDAFLSDKPKRKRGRPRKSEVNIGG